MSKFSKKIGSDANYKRPDVTYQEKLTNEEIADKMKGYVKVDDVSDVPLNTHIRYFTIGENGEKKFRSGGFLKIKTDPDRYVILTNGKVDWPVQISESILFRKLSHNEEIDALHTYYKKKLEERDNLIQKLKKFIEVKHGVIIQSKQENQNNDRPDIDVNKNNQPKNLNKKVSTDNKSSVNSIAKKSTKSIPKYKSKQNISTTKSQPKSKPRANSKYQSKQYNNPNQSKTNGRQTKATNSLKGK